jgi:phosphate propanoyltransferase
MSPLDAAIFGVTQGETVKVGIEGTDRKLIFDDVCIRVAEDMRLEMHIDTDEANAAGIDGGQAGGKTSPDKTLMQVCLCWT